MPRRSKRYRSMVSTLERGRAYSTREAIEILKNNPHKPRFDETVEVALALGIDTRQADQQVRGTFSLPHGTGKETRVVVFADGAPAEAALAAGAVAAGGEELAKHIEAGWLEFDVAIAHPAAMRYVGRLGRVLGPQGKMPSPKSGTVTPEVERAVREFRAGRIEFRANAQGNIHVAVGKLSFNVEQLVENVDAFIEHVKSLRPAAVKGVYLKSAHVTSTMGPGLRLAV